MFITKDELSRIKFKSPKVRDYVNSMEGMPRGIYVWEWNIIINMERNSDEYKKSKEIPSSTSHSSSNNHCSSDFDEEAYDRRGREGHGWSSSIDGFTNDEVDSYNDRVYEREHGRGRDDM